MAKQVHQIPSLDYFCDLKKKWGISIAAMIFRAHDLGMIDKGEKTMLYQGMSKRRWRGALREPFDDPSEMPLELPRMLRRGIETILNENIFGLAAIRGTLAFPPREAEQIMGLKSGFFDSAQIVSFPVSPRDGDLRAVDLESGNILEFPRQRQS